jgi:hypothetical protein
MFHIGQNRAFVDGNKRTGANAAITFLLSNHWGLDFSEDEVVELVLSASGGASKSARTETLKAHYRPASDPLLGKILRTSAPARGCQYIFHTPQMPPVRISSARQP